MIFSGGRIRIAAVGKLKDPHYRALQKIYQDRVKRYTQVLISETKAFVGTGLPEKVAVEREGALLEEITKTSNRRFALEPGGRMMNSEKFAVFLRKELETYGKISFCIGGPLGLSKDVSKKCDKRISMSLLTFPHELARIVFLEQLYRAFSILNNESYHK